MSDEYPDDAADVAALLDDWRTGTVAKAARRSERVQQRQRAEGDDGPHYRTLTVVVTGAGLEDVLRSLRRHPDVMFAATEPGVTKAALEAGAEPGDWEAIVPGES